MAPDAQVFTGTLSGTVADAPSSVNLTALGKVDWIHFGAAGPDKYDRRAKVPLFIDTFRTIGAMLPRSYQNGLVAYTWSDGMPTLTGTGVTGGVAVDGRRNGFQLNIRASKDTVRTVRIYVGAANTHGLLSAMLSDGSALPYDGMVKVSNAEVSVFVFTLKFRAGADNKSLLVAWRSQLDNGFVTIESLALE